MELEPAQVIELWFHYEEIAMHFNQLIIQYRLQLMGGAGAIGAVAVFLIQSKDDEERRYLMRSVVSFIMFFLLLAAAFLDIFYYNKLLLGAVNALLEFEKAHPPINMSTLIHDEVEGFDTITIWVWYAAILVPVAGFGLRSYWRYKSFQKSEPDDLQANES
ncbi:MAG: hypothetical protein IIC21_11760 [Chloroflexi bacterium]|nr:hypothetical protein [Chloroflexota bacterium]